jgi:hypothetical protein
MMSTVCNTNGNFESTDGAESFLAFQQGAGAPIPEPSTWAIEACYYLEKFQDVENGETTKTGPVTDSNSVPIAFVA